MKRLRARRIVLAGGVALLSAAAIASPVSAECDARSLPTRDIADYRGILFTATVTSTTDEPTRRPAAGTDYDTEVILDVGRVYRGKVDEQLVVDGWDAGCSLLLVNGLQVGDSLLISLGDTKAFADPTVEGPVLVWRRVDGTWRFYEQAVQYGSESASYPRSVRNATTTAQILRLVGPGTAPDTAVAPPEAPPVERTDPVALLLGAGAVGAVVGFYRTRGAGRPRST